MILGDEPIGKQIQTWRTNLGLTVTEISQRAGVAEQVYRRIENGLTLNPMWSTVVRIFRGMDAQIDVTVAPRKQHPQPQQQHQQEQLPLEGLPKKKATRNRLHADA